MCLQMIEDDSIIFIIYLLKIIKDIKEKRTII